jgi:hypothetical protein
MVVVASSIKLTEEQQQQRLKEAAWALDSVEVDSWCV